MVDRRLEDVPVEVIVCPPQIRDVRSEDDRIVQHRSVKENGILVPLLGHREGGGIILDDGYGRLEAARAEGLATVPMLVSDRAPTPAERGILQIIVNTQFAGLRVMELSRAYAHLMKETNWSAAEVSSKLGGKPSTSHLCKLLTLQVFSREVQDFIDAGRIPMSSAYAIAIVPDAAERERLIQEVLGGRLSRDKLVAQSKAIRAKGGVRRSRSPKTARRERVVIPFGQGRSIAVSAPALSVDSVVAWLGELAERIRSAAAGSGQSLVDVVKSISGAAR